MCTCVYMYVEARGQFWKSLSIALHLFLKLFFACICVQYMHVYTCSHVLACVWKPEIDARCLPWLFSAFWGRVRSWTQSLPIQLVLSSQLAPEILSCARITGRPPCWPSIYMGECWGFKLQSSCLFCKCLSLWTTSLTLPPYFFETGSLTEPGTHLLARLAGQLALLSLPLQHWDYQCAIPMPGFCMCA